MLSVPIMKPRLLSGLPLLVILICMIPAWLLRAESGDNWSAYLGGENRNHYSNLAQINTGNVSQLEIAWIYRAGLSQPDDRTEMQCNPLAIDGTLYATLPSAIAIALDAVTGRELWRFSPVADAEERGETRSQAEVTTNRNRGVAYWQDGDDRRILHTAGHFLYALDPATGRPIPTFGDAGRVDFDEGLDRDVSNVSAHSSTTPGAFFENLYVLPIRTNEGPGPSAPGHIRAFDVGTGEIVWTFRTIPHPGEFGYETWPPDAWEYAGGANCWAGMAIDAERALLFVPTGSPTYDFWGGNRLGENLFATTLLCLDARTGRRVWHFQVTRHDIFDRDLPAPPNLVTIERGGHRIPAVAQVTKTGHVFVFHRETGEPLFPIEEMPVPSSNIPGETAWSTQPFPLKPEPFSRQGVAYEDLTVRTPEAHRVALERFTRLKPHAPYQPPSLEGSLLMPGLHGGAEWGGAAVDPDGVMYINESSVPWIVQLIETAGRRSSRELGRDNYTLYCATCHGSDREGDALQGIPALADLEKRMERPEVLARITEGRGGMPSFGFLPAPARDALADFLLGLDRRPAGNDPPPPIVAPGTHLHAYHDVPFVKTGRGAWLDDDGYPAVKPPWGTLNAIDLNSGEYLWKVPLGEYPALRAQGVPPTGTSSYGGPVVTAGGLVFIAATLDEKIRAFDRRTGEILWEAQLPAAGYATPSTYMAGGRQYVVIACGGGKLDTKWDDAYVAFALPEAKARERSTSNAQHPTPNAKMGSGHP